MSKQGARLSVTADGPGAIAACRRGLAELNWQVLEDHGEYLVAREDPARLHCSCPQAQIEIRLVEDVGGASLELTTTVPGFGPISSRHARDTSMSVIRRVRTLGA